MQPDGNKTRLELTIKPNPQVYVFTIVFPLFGFLFGRQMILDEKLSRENIFLIVLLIIIFPLAGCFYAQAARDNLRKAFVKYFNLKRK